MFKKLKIHIKNKRPKGKKKGKRRKENSTELPKPNIEAEVYNNNKIFEKKKTAQSLIRFHSTNKINNYVRGGNKREKKRKEKDKNSKTYHITIQT